MSSSPLPMPPGRSAMCWISMPNCVPQSPCRQAPHCFRDPLPVRAAPSHELKSSSSSCEAALWPMLGVQRGVHGGM